MPFVGGIANGRAAYECGQFEEESVSIRGYDTIGHARVGDPRPSAEPHNRITQGLPPRPPAPDSSFPLHPFRRRYTAKE